MENNNIFKVTHLDPKAFMWQVELMHELTMKLDKEVKKLRGEDEDNDRV